MIWIWIAAAIFISVFLLRKKQISLENYIWVLLPVDMYGLTVAGVTIKPYMIFSLILLIKVLKNRKGKLFIGNSGQASIIAILLGALVVNFFNGGTTSSIMTVLMALLVYFCACLYASNINESIDEIPDVIIATSIGYGLVFIAAYVFFLIGLNLPGLTTSVRSDPGILMCFSDMYGGSLINTYRLRGFNIDPNSSVGVFLSAFSIGLMQLLSGKKREKTYGVSFIICLIYIILTNSRMGMVAALIVLLFTGSYAIKKMEKKRKQKMLIGLLCLSLLLIMVIVFTGIGDWILTRLTSIYGNRSGFSDKYGRGSIWKESISAWINQDIFFGVGINQIQYWTSVGRVAHNTWLEWLFSCGIFIGGAADLYFFSLLVSGFKRRRTVAEKDWLLYQALLMGLLAMICCLFSIDNITNGYLWFFAITLIKSMSVFVDRGLLTCSDYEYSKPNEVIRRS